MKPFVIREVTSPIDRFVSISDLPTILDKLSALIYQNRHEETVHFLNRR